MWPNLKASFSPHNKYRNAICAADQRVVGRAFTLKAMVERIGVTYQMLQKYETGGCRVSAGQLWHIAENLNVTLLILFDGGD
jgi:hypothetical protein